MHLRHAVEALTFLQERQKDRTPLSFSPLDSHCEAEEAHTVEGRSEDQPYDGGWEPGGIGWFDDRSMLWVCDEAGPTGDDLDRVLCSLGVRCDVVAPSLIPKKSGDRSRPTTVTPGSWRACTGPAN